MKIIQTLENISAVPGTEKGNGIIQRLTFKEGETKIGDMTGENFKKNLQSFSLENSSDVEEDVEDKTKPDIPAEALASFNAIKVKLGTLGWQLRKTEDRDHCYTEVIRHYWSDPEKEEGKEPNYDVPAYMLNEKTNDQVIPGDQVEKIVYYNPDCPLIDLIHEMDHVEQQEKTKEKTGNYRYTTWDAWEWGGKQYEQTSPSVSSAFYSDEHIAFQSLVNQKLGFSELELSKGQNEFAEYHNYMREFLRYCAWGAGDSDKQKIVAKVNEHRDKAKEFASENEKDPFIAACESIKPIAELESEYALAQSQKDK
ncbi:hypothetical protein QTN47_23010 [Danxiaibacter flavus]|uniref:Uncharacterized protein n=1 Tax=Danxiaibacter flavus TaxID=3049108 RepID=A0ABV3ZLK3_9BACT|nr:hypothetical protein QNM32_23015 [Chitinophagaceae bacterium DXS]